LFPPDRQKRLAKIIDITEQLDETIHQGLLGMLVLANPRLHQGAPYPELTLM
jgi:hypothetical protein